MKDKISLEDHITTAENNQLWDSSGEAARNGKDYMARVEEHLLNPELRLEIMDQFGIDKMILSLTSPGAQSILDSKIAVDFAKHTNDLMTKQIVEKHPKRFLAFATVALQQPEKAAEELERAVKQLGMKGVLINGYTNTGDENHAQYLDEKPVRVFWDKVAELDVPVYLHPREPLPNQCNIYKNYSSLIGSAWGFGHETATHAVRLMLSGLFDEYPHLKILLGHLGEGLPFLLPRLESRLYQQRHGTGLGSAKKKVSEYFNANFYLTTSGHFHSKALRDTISEIGVDRVMFSVDSPYEEIAAGVTWFDNADISDNDKQKIGRENALQLFKLMD